MFGIRLYRPLEHLSSCDLDLRTDLDRVKANRHAKYLGQRLFRSKVTVRSDTQTRIQTQLIVWCTRHGYLYCIDQSINQSIQTFTQRYISRKWFRDAEGVTREYFPSTLPGSDVSQWTTWRQRKLRRVETRRAAALTEMYASERVSC